MSAICVCVHTNRCGAWMTDNLSTKSFYLTHLSAVTIFLLSEAALMVSLSGSGTTFIVYSMNIYSMDIKPMYVVL